MRWGIYYLGALLIGFGLAGLFNEQFLSAAFIGGCTELSGAAMMICAAFIDRMEK